MQIPPSYTITPEMLELISRIEAKRIYFSSLTLPLPVKEKIQRVSFLKSSLFSARIEGNPLNFPDLDSRKVEPNVKREVFNVLAAVQFIDRQKAEKNITKNLLLQLHARVLRGINPDTGRFRTKVSAIFNQASVVIYMPPPPSEIPTLINKLLSFTNSDKEKFPLINAFISHLIFEKVHPFLDGNGRVGRILIAAVLKAKGWDFTFTVPFEEYLDSNKDAYYFHLDRGMKEPEIYILFMLEAFLKEVEQVQEQVEAELKKKEGSFLPPRQEEIYNIIKDQRIISFDIIRRRFLQVPPRTLRYDLKKLVDADLVEKAGETKGSYYRVKNNPGT